MFPTSGGVYCKYDPRYHSVAKLNLSCGCACRLGCYAFNAEVQRLCFICQRVARTGWKLDVSTYWAYLPSSHTDRDHRFSVTASITFGGSQLVLAAITLWNEDYVPTGKLSRFGCVSTVTDAGEFLAWQTVLTYWAALCISVAVNILFNKWVKLLPSLMPRRLTLTFDADILRSSILYACTGQALQ